LKFIYLDQWDSWASERFLCEGDILWNSTGTGTIGRAALYKHLEGYKRVVADSHVTIVRANKAYCNSSLLHYFIRSSLVQSKIEDMQSGSTNQVELSRGQVLNTKIPLAPLNEQKRIANKLDRLLAKVDACRERCDRLPLILKRFRQSVLAAATSGELTKDWRLEHEADDKTESNLIGFDVMDSYCFGDYEFPASWDTTRLEEISEITGGITKDSKKQNLEDEELPYLRVANVQRGFLDLKEIKTIQVPKRRVEELLLKPGDILFNEGGDIDKLGSGWIWNGEIKRCTFQNHVFRVRLKNTDFEPKFFSWYGNSRGFDYFLSFGKQTTNLASINKTVLSTLPVVIPPAEEQHEIVQRVEKLFAFADLLEARYQAARAKCDRLTPALLEKAFQGELVPQDPNDEPASVLLERIKSLRSNTETNQSKPQRRKTASEKTYRFEVKMLTRKEIQPSHLSNILKASGSLTAEALWAASKLEIDGFYDQLKDEEAQNLLKETKAENSDAIRLLEAA
jgi:restriction endonuclease S subunit